jgi:uncharacterized protein YggT (Ycf19 family)
MPPSADPALTSYNEGKVKRRRLILVIGKAVVLFIYLIFGAYVVILGIAFFLRLFGANPTADFADWIYRASARIMEPFRGIFPTTQLSDTSVFDASLLFAIVMYSIVVIILHGIVDWFAYRISRVDAERERRRYWTNLAATPAVGPSPAPAPVAAPVSEWTSTPLPTRTAATSGVESSSGPRGDSSGSLGSSSGLPNGPTEAERAATSGVGRVNPPTGPSATAPSG